MDVQMDERHFPPGNERGIIAERGCRCQKWVDSGSTFKVRLVETGSVQNITNERHALARLSVAAAPIDGQLSRCLLEGFS